MQNHLRSFLEAGSFFCSAELVLNRDHSAPEAEKFVRDAAREPEGIKVLSLTDLAGGNPSLPPEAFASRVLDCGLTPLAHLTGKDGNRSCLEGRLHALARIGVENLLVLTGDAPAEAFQGRAKPVFDLDSVLTLRLVETLREGLAYEAGRREIRTSPFDFLAGAAVNPYKSREPDQMMQFYKLELKIAAGARFIITQLGFNLRKLYELRQYLVRRGWDRVPVIANIYVPTSAVAKMMKRGEIAGCAIPDRLLRLLDGETKPQRLERAALMLAAARDLGFAGGHIGGFGLTHADLMHVAGRACEIGSDWEGRVDELVHEMPGEFYLLPRGSSGLSNGEGAFQLVREGHHLTLNQRLSTTVHRLMIEPGSFGARFLAARLKREHGLPDRFARGRGFWHAVLSPSGLYRKGALGCMSCGDCIQDHLNYAGCTMRKCYKNLRNGPCGGSRIDGTCEVDANLPCVWNHVYQGAIASGDHPGKFARVLIPPRNWRLDQTDALANRLTGLDNFTKRVSFGDARPAHQAANGGSNAC